MFCCHHESACTLERWQSVNTFRCVAEQSLDQANLEPVRVALDCFGLPVVFFMVALPPVSGVRNDQSFRNDTVLYFRFHVQY